MFRTLISLGANLGNVAETMHHAKCLLHEAFPSSRLLFSHLYRTPPVGGPSGQSDFLNAVVALESRFDVWHIWEKVKSIEMSLGRQRFHRWEARRIDIDVLLHEDQRIWTPHFKVPHPRMCMRSFILKPSVEIASNWIDPVTGWSIAQLSDHLDSQGNLLVITPTVAQGDQLRSAITDPALLKSIQWLELSLAEARSFFEQREVAPKLLIAAVSTPDPESILWEDFSRDWARLLGMESSSNRLRGLRGPRYLLPGDNPIWAAHEVMAAYQAMRCRVEIASPFD